MKKYIYTLAFVFLFLFAFFGLVCSSTLFHELSHKQDYKDVAQDESICYLQWNSDAIGVYHFSYNKSQKEIVNEIDKYTEIKAYSISTLVFSLFFICFCIVLKYLFFEEKI